MFAALLAVGAVDGLRRPESVAEEAAGIASELPDMQGMFVLVLVITTPLLLLPASLLFPALRRRRPALAATGVALVFVELAVFVAIHFADVRSPRSCIEASPVSYLVPLWLLAILVSATLPSGRRALALDASGAPRRIALGLGFAATVVLVAAGALELVANLRSERPWTEAADGLVPGATRRDVVAALDRACELSAVGASTDVLRADCRPFVPAACACALVAGERLELAFDVDGGVQILTSIRRRPALVAARGTEHDAASGGTIRP